MTSELQEWKEKLTFAIGDPYDEDVGRAGETPFSTMCGTLENIKGASLIKIVHRAFISIVFIGPAKNYDSKVLKNYWSRVSALSYFLPNKNDEELRGVFHSKLFGKDAVEDSLKSYVLNGFTASGGKLSLDEFHKLDDVGLRRQSPFSWIDALFASSLFKTAEKEILNLIKNDGIGINIILFNFPHWKKQWSSEESFYTFGKKLREELKEEKDKLTLDKFFL